MSSCKASDGVRVANEGGIGGGVHIAGGGMFDSGAATNSSFLGDL